MTGTSPYRTRWPPSVGSGPSDQDRAQLVQLLLTQENCPFVVEPTPSKATTWVEPTIVIEVEFAEWEPGHHLRHPTFQGQRTDTTPDAVFRDAVYNP